MRPNLRQFFPYLAVAALVAATVWALSVEPVERADFTFVNGTEIESVDPAIISGQPEGRICWALFEGLTNWHPETLEPMPGVAERWDVSDDGLTYTFHLRDNARWSNGEPVTAGDFVWSYRRFLDPKSSGKYSYQLYYLKNGQTFNTGKVEPGDAVEVELHEKPDGALPFARGILVPGKLVRELRVDVVTHEPLASDVAEDAGLSAFVVEVEGEQRTYVKTASAAEGLSDAIPCNDVLLDFAEVGARAKDDRTLILTLQNPAAFFINLTGFYPLFPTNPRCVETYGIPGWTDPSVIVSNGAFTLEERRIRDRIRLRKSETYWNRDAVKIETVDALAVESATTAVNLYMTGQVDWITTVPSTIVTELLEQDRSDFKPSPEMTVNFYRVNTTRPPLDNPLVRQALNLAIDKRQLVETITRAGEIPARTIVPPGMPNYTSADGPEYDPKRAKELLAEAGYPGGRGFRKIQILYNTEDTHQLIAELIQHFWKGTLGIEVELQNQEWNAYLTSQQNMEYDICRAGWIGDYPDPNTFLDMFMTGNENNQTGWSNAAFDELIREAGRETDVEKRLELLRKAERMLVEGSPVLPLYYRVSKNMVRPYVSGFYPNLQDVHPLYSIAIDREAKQAFLDEKGAR